MMDNVATEQLGLSLERASFLKKRSQSFLSAARQSGLADHSFTQQDDALSDDHAAVISGMECGEEVTLLLESLQNIDFAIHKLDAINNDEVAEPDVMAFYQDAIELLDEQKRCWRSAVKSILLTTQRMRSNGMKVAWFP
ncbi:hypothetical protein [Kosakonia quasisacchari]|uniref:hypothetical protein n=1 Tax=Kosakonia quasisacchari TaxID=2529380 RepID=UPI0039E01EB2